MDLSRFASASACVWPALLLAGCGGGGGGGGGSTSVGSLRAKPDGGHYFEDEHSGGGTERFRLVEILWGRLVDVHGVDASGATLSDPVLRDLVVNESLLDDPDDFVLETNPITQDARLIVRRVPGAPDQGDGSFETLVKRAMSGLAGVLPKGEDDVGSTPFSYVARNAALLLRFDDLLDDGEENALELAERVRVVTGYPPVTPLVTRVVFDPNHGGVTGGRFHSTRVLVDLTVSEAEAADSPVALQLNSLGLPRSQRSSPAPNVSLRLPTRLAPGAGQFSVLCNLAGRPLDAETSAPFDPASPTQDLVRALRSGSDEDVNNGFLFDPEPPRVIGAWPCAVLDAQALSGGFDWSLALRFTTACRKTPERGDVVTVGDTALEVSATAVAPDGSGRTELTARVLNVRAPTRGELIGVATYQNLYRSGLAVERGCWARFLPPPRQYPSTDVSSDARTVFRFSEPMDPASGRPFDSFLTVHGGESTPPDPFSLVVGRIQPSVDLRELAFVPSTSYAHAGDRPLYHVRLRATDGVTDLAGNELAEPLPTVEFTIDPQSARTNNDSFVLRLDTPDELEPIGFPDLRGQFVYRFDRGSIRPREVAFGTRPVDRSNPLVSIMPAFQPGVATPLSPLGSKLQALWRYADLGWSIRDETKYNLDVIGLSWSPARGIVASDFYEQFEVRLSHTGQLPDERPRQPTTGGVKYPLSGLWLSPRPFADNILADPVSPQKVMNARALGYRVDPNDLTFASSGTPLMPWPVNRGGGELVGFTWRDTAVTLRAAHHGAGVPLDMETGLPLGLEDTHGSFDGPGRVSAVGLPLLMEFRCYPSSTGIGLNPLAIFIASNVNPGPNFRAYSTGGFDTLGQRVNKNPDLELVPTGGLNPNSRPPGLPTSRSADNAVYAGALDYVVRISRAHTIWIDTRATRTRFADVVLEPDPSAFPSGTEILVDFRGAEGFLDAGLAPFVASQLDPIGDPERGSILFHGGDPAWKRTLQDLDGARYLQLRFSFLNNVSAGLVPELSGVGVAYWIDDGN